jgi:hypothetical protein
MQKLASEMKTVTFADLYCCFITFIVLFYFILFYTVSCSFNNDEGTNKPFKIKIKINKLDRLTNLTEEESLIHKFLYTRE